MTFDDRLARTLLAVLSFTAGCGGVTSTTPKTTGESGDTGTVSTGTLAAMCDGATGPEHYLVSTGWVEIEPGGTCPDAAEAAIEVYGCTWLEWQGITCAFDHVETNQVFVDDGYGGYHTDAAKVPTGYKVGEPVDLCLYEAVFYLPPDHPTCGRPLLSEGEPVVATVRSGASRWATGAAPDPSGLSDAERAAVHAYWLGSALLEHASVASFSQAALALMRFGAPPELLAGAHQAAIDEVEHARLCFSLASAYAGAAEGPGRLGAGGLPPIAASLGDFAEALVREGCVAETLAAVDAAARLARASDPAVRAALEVIVRDESAHAALAWRTLAWVLGQAPELRARLADVLGEERARWSSPAGDGEPSPAASAHGLLSDAARGAALARAWQDVIGPTFAAL